MQSANLKYIPASSNFNGSLLLKSWFRQSSLMSPRALSDDIDVLILKQATEKQIVKADAYVAGQNFNHVFLENCTCFGFCY